MFHGFNSVQKSFPWYESRILDQQRIQDTADFGFNVIRLGAMWAGVEPEEGKINETYVEILKSIGKISLYYFSTFRWPFFYDFS